MAEHALLGGSPRGGPHGGGGGGVPTPRMGPVECPHRGGVPTPRGAPGAHSGGGGIPQIPQIPGVSPLVAGGGTHGGVPSPRVPPTLTPGSFMAIHPWGYGEHSAVWTLPPPPAPTPQNWGTAPPPPPKKTKLRLHAEGPVQPHHLPVDHGVFSQGLDEVGVFEGVSQPRRKRHLLPQKITNSFGQTSQ